MATMPSMASQLEALYQADQAARVGKNPATINWVEVSKQDAIRRQQVRKILDNGDDFTANEYFSAALVMQHGSEPADFKQAMVLAQKAAKIDPSHNRAKWLACAAEDRYLIKLGKSQVWGTQLRRKPYPNKGYDIYYLIDFDKSARADSLRQQGCGLPSIKQMEQKLKTMAKMPKRNDQYQHWKS
jgi:hypothetical protein